MTVAVAMTVAACGGSNETVVEPDVEVEAVDDVVREAGDDVLAINGCRIEPNTVCPRANLSGANLSGANLRGADLRWANLIDADLSEANLWGAAFCDTTMPDGSVQGDNC